MPKEAKWKFALIAVVTAVALYAAFPPQEKIHLGLDLRGGSELRYKVVAKANLPQDQRRNLVDRVIGILQQRINPQGTIEMRIQPLGKNEVLIQLPGVGKKELAQIKDRIERAGNLQFRLVTNDPNLIAEARQGRVPEGYEKIYYKGMEPIDGKGGRWELVSKRVELTGDYLRDAYPTRDRTGRPAVGFQFDARGRKIFARLTEEHIGQQLAIVLDGVLYSAPQIKSRIGASGIIEGSFTQEEVNNLVTVLRSGRLPADLVFESENTVGPTLGMDSIRMGVRAAILGFVLVVVFIGIYYKWMGVIADLALLLNLILVIGIIAMLKATLTMPGIAGLILTVGMAVDANILIFERIREERANGRSPALALKNGYDRAFTTIVDANLTTLITAVILYLVGTGPVKGFAVTLSFGILMSMFCALFVTRAIFDRLLGAGILKDFRMLRIVKEPNVQFVRVRYIAMSISAILIVIGMIAYVWRGEAKYDIDFTGGTLLYLHLAQPTDIGEVRQLVAKKAGYRNAEVQSLWAGRESGESKGMTSKFGIRIKKLSREQQEHKIREDLQKAFGSKKLLKSIEFKQPTDVVVQLTTKIGEEELIKYLSRAGYGWPEIKSASPLKVTAKRFRISWGHVSTIEEREKLYDAVQPALASKVREITTTFEIGGEKLEAPLRLQQGQKAPKKSTALELTFTPKLDTVTISRAIRAAVRGKVSDDALSTILVEGRDEDRTSLVCNKVFLWADRSVMQALAKVPGKRLKMPDVTFDDAGMLNVGLKKAMNEAQFRKLLASLPVDNPVEHLVSVDVKDDTWEIVLKPLSLEKMQEKIRQDLLKVLGNRAQIAIASIETIGGETAADVKSKSAPEKAPGQGKATADEKSAEKSAERTKNEKTTREGKKKTAANSEGKTKEPGKGKNAKGGKKEQGALKPVSMVALKVSFKGAVAKDVLRDLLESSGYADKVETPLTGSGTVTSITLRVKSDQVNAAKKAIRKAIQSFDPFERVVSIGATVAGEMKERAFLALFFAMIVIVLYIWLRFGEIRFGIGAVIALCHDVLITMGALAIADWLGDFAIGKIFLLGDIKINLPVIAAFLTIVGYSLNDTIVVFDRIRENIGPKRRNLIPEVVNASINQTLSRTILTSLTTFVVVFVLYLFGGSVIHGFALALMVGIIVGTYSSIYVASPILLDWPIVKAVLLLPITAFRFIMGLARTPFRKSAPAK